MEEMEHFGEWSGGKNKVGLGVMLRGVGGE